MYFNRNNKFYHGIMFHHFHDDNIHTKSQGSINKDDFFKIINFIGKKNILDAKLHFINEIGLTNHLSPTRANGLLEMVKQMKAYAYSLMLKNK